MKFFGRHLEQVSQTFTGNRKVLNSALCGGIFAALCASIFRDGLVCFFHSVKLKIFLEKIFLCRFFSKREYLSIIVICSLKRNRIVDFFSVRIGVFSKREC